MVTRLKKSKTFIDYPQTIEDVYANLEDCNHTKKENFQYRLAILWQILKLKNGTNSQ